MVEILGYVASVIIGFTLGLVGGGGSILTVPVLAYLFDTDAVLATSYSLFIVGATALTGAGQYIQKGLVSYKTAAVFAIPSFIAVYITRRYILPAVPEHLFDIGTLSVSKDLAIMVWFAIIMLAAAWSMIRSRKRPESDESAPQTFNYPLIVLEGLLVGFLTGVVGAGGGFLIIPALVLLARLPMKMAVGTSLLIIAVKSLFGFAGDLGAGLAIEWPFLLLVTGLAIGGIFLGSYASTYIPGHKLKSGFGWFILVMSVFILTRELLLS